jgi:Sec-independent protein translocase protein TatA
MASFIDLFNPSFFMFLGILVLVVAVIVIFFESRLREQNHKISSMLSIISTLAEDINTIHHHQNTLSNNTRRGGEGSSTLIDVSDDDESTDDDSINQNIKILNITLNDIDNNSDTNSECSNNLEIESMDDSVTSDEANLDEEFIEVLQDEIDVKVDVEDEDDDDDDESEVKEVKEVKNFSSELKTISIHLEEPVIDYTKLSLIKLKSVVVDKGLTTNASKLKKSEILKLLNA